MPLTIEHFPENPLHPEHGIDRRYCFVWTRALDGKRIIFGCSTQEDCERLFAQYEQRAAIADERNMEAM